MGISKDGKRLINWIKEKGFYIINGAVDGDWEGESHIRGNER